MSISPGTRLGAYEILALIGAGGPADDTVTSPITVVLNWETGLKK